MLRAFSAGLGATVPYLQEVVLWLALEPIILRKTIYNSASSRTTTDPAYLLYATRKVEVPRASEAQHDASKATSCSHDGMF